jgi:MoaA/NifB/PqqE/SkfB family radical SAM enzyme
MEQETTTLSIPNLYRLKKPPFLEGYTYSGADAYSARDTNKLLAVRIETNKSCNLKCLYCYSESEKSNKTQVKFSTLKRIIRQAYTLGAKSIVVIGGGEPTLYPQFKELISYINRLEMVPVVFSNCIRIDKELAEFLYDSNASVMGKLDSLKPAVQDYFAGVDGVSNKIRRGLDNLLEAGFNESGEAGGLRLGVSFVSNRLNIGEIEEIWHFCRINNIFPNMEILTPTGRAKEYLNKFYLDTYSIQNYKLKLLDIDRVYYGYNWLPHTPLAASGCLQHLYSLYVTITGDVRPCAPTKFDEHPALKINGIYPYNVNIMSLEAIFESPLFKYVRNIDKHLGGKCSGCEHNDQCIGCRGYSYSVGINEGKHPIEALKSECRQCFK